MWRLDDICSHSSPCIFNKFGKIQRQLLLVYGEETISRQPLTRRVLFARNEENVEAWAEAVHFLYEEDPNNTNNNESALSC